MSEQCPKSNGSKLRSASIAEKPPAYDKRPRPAIPDQIQRELWARAAGRCQFHGCNEILYKDSVTGKSANLSTISHIVAFSPEGPRGHEKRSIELEKEISNLMLTCKKHGNLIDNLNYVSQFPEEVLIGYKDSHEKRVHAATEPVFDAKTNLLIFQGRISGRETFISQEEARRAIRPRWPGTEDSLLVDVNSIPLEVMSPEAWAPAVESIREKVERIFRTRPGELPADHWSVFALAPIPLLVFLGYQLTSRLNIDLFQHQRSKEGGKWCWNDGEHGEDEGFETFIPDEKVAVSDVAILVSLTSVVDRASVESVISSDYLVYEIRAKQPSPDLIKYRTQLSAFGSEFRHILRMIREDIRDVSRVHLFLACPAPIAIECGRSIIENADSSFHVYEYRKPNYYHVVSIETGAIKMKTLPDR